MNGNRILKNLALRLGAILLCCWLLCMTLLTLLLAEDVRRQAARVCTETLEEALEELRARDLPESAEAGELAFSLPEVHFTPAVSLPLLRARELTVFKGSLSMNSRGVVMNAEGIDTGDAAPGTLGLRISEGKLAFKSASDVKNAAGGLTALSRLSFLVTFREDPLRGGSFPSAEYSGGRFDESPRLVPPAEQTVPAQYTAPELMDGIAEGSLRFDSASLRQSAVLRGVWLTDASGQKRFFVLAACGWSPLQEAVRLLPPLYLLSLPFFLLPGLLLCLHFRRTLTKPLRELAADLERETLPVSDREYDYRMEYAELRALLSAWLLRRQLLEAETRRSGGPPPEVCPVLLAGLRRAEDSLQPILCDRGQRIVRSLQADGRVAASREDLENALLAFFRETFPYLEDNGEMRLATASCGGWLLVELRIRVKHRLDREQFRALWDGVYREPRDGDAPGAKLRRAISEIPGAFTAVRSAGHGLALTLGLPRLPEDGP